MDSDPGNVVQPGQRSDSSFIYDTTIGALEDSHSIYDGQTVQVVGEAVGDCIDAKDGAHCWVSLDSLTDKDQATVAVYMTYDQAKQIDAYGRYGVVGTTLQVRGTYHQVCSDHDGVSDIHAASVTATEQGHAQPDGFDFSKFVPGLALVVMGGVLAALFYLVREQTR